MEKGKESARTQWRARGGQWNARRAAPHGAGYESGSARFGAKPPLRQMVGVAPLPSWIEAAHARRGDGAPIPEDGFLARSSVKFHERCEAARQAGLAWLEARSRGGAQPRPSEAEWSALWEAMEGAELDERRRFAEGVLGPLEFDCCSEPGRGGAEVDEGWTKARESHAVDRARALGKALRSAWAFAKATELTLWTFRR